MQGGLLSGEVFSTGLHHFLESGHSVVVVVCDRRFQILAWNRAFLGCCEGDSPKGQDVFRFIRSLDNAILTEEIVTEDEAPLPVLLRSSYRSRMFSGFIYDCGENFLLLCEKIGDSDNDVVETIAQLTGEIANVSRDLRRRNRELAAANERIALLSRTDPLTGLLNRRTFDEKIGEVMSAARRHHHPFSIVMADLDRFKRVNDTWGHAAGDRLLQAFSMMLTESCRKEDSVYRFGGEEFLLLLPYTELAAACDLARRIGDRLRSADPLDCHERFTASFGAACSKGDESIDEMLKRADDGLYAAKEGGRDRVVALEI